ncbi:flagellin lysine-N-methylase [Clostridium sp. MSJ-8]|uniref:flagellin lysine-N-methylase n=1 Tax=Clostridium sp. MSJ-8 TaxID=2841510 RepID=UPI001C0EE236|nr:flagellin lysine-N-methylase [Clostridium sp. MSJ-8]MBU5487094.1 flagellin lysine-N-methylase [Clostridium sp. MSJ-8]
MAINIMLRYPKYLKGFRCIADKCEDTCCAGWDIDIDKVTFKRYFKVNNQEMKKMFQKNVHNNQYCTSEDIDYGRVKLKNNKRCAFLDDNNLCIIYSNIGEDYLSNVCTCYPRITNIIDGNYEMTLDVSCPEAARKVLSLKDGIEFITEKVTLNKHIISGNIDTRSKELKGSIFMHFKEIRQKSIDIIENKKYSLDERLYVLGVFLDNITELGDGDVRAVGRYIDNFNTKDALALYMADDMRYMIQISFFKGLLDKLDVFKEVASKTFKAYTEKVLKGYDFVDNITEKSQEYVEAYKKYNNDIMSKYGYIFENYLINFIYNNLFPFSENDVAFHGYIMLLIRYSYMRFFLVGLMLDGEELDEEKIITFIQTFLKTTEHHKTYYTDVLEEVVQNEYDNMMFVNNII